MSSFTFVDIVVLYNLTQILGDCQLFADNLELHIPVLGVTACLPSDLLVVWLVFYLLLYRLRHNYPCARTCPEAVQAVQICWLAPKAIHYPHILVAYPCIALICMHGLMDPAEYNFVVSVFLHLPSITTIPYDTASCCLLHAAVTPLKKGPTPYF